MNDFENYYLKSVKIPTYKRFVDKKIDSLGKTLVLKHLKNIQDYLEADKEETDFSSCFISLEEFLYPVCQSITQSLRCQAGIKLELLTEQALLNMGISFGRQICVKDNIVFKKTKSIKGLKILDFVIPKPDVGDNLEAFTHVSCKTKLRERYNQDKHLSLSRTLLVTHDPIHKNSSKLEEIEILYVPRSEQTVAELEILFSVFLKSHCHHSHQ